MLTMILIITFKKFFPGIFPQQQSNIPNIFLPIISGIIFLLLILVPVSGFTQQYSYSVLRGDKQIGTLSVKSVKAEKRTMYSIWSEAKTGFIFNININVMIEETFNMGEMEHSTFIRKIDGIEMIKNTVDKLNDGLLLKHNDGDDKIISSKINYSMGAMYFIEPLNRKFVYSENYQQFVPVFEAGKNRYLIKFPDGNKSYYTYNDGMCTGVEVHTNWTFIIFKLVEEQPINAVYYKTKY